jgi:hypothetical protein
MPEQTQQEKTVIVRNRLWIFLDASAAARLYFPYDNDDFGDS